MSADKKRIRRNHSDELKTRILAECAEPGASVAKVAMAHGINANLVFGWRKQDRLRHEAVAAAVQALTVRQAAAAVATPAQFVPVAVMSAVDVTVDIEVSRGAVTMKARWPLNATLQCAAWARELLK